MPASLTQFTQNTKIQSGQVNTNFQNLSDKIRPTFVFVVDQTLSTGTNKTPIIICTNTLTIEQVYAAVKVAPAGAAIICDIEKNGTSIWNSNPSNRVTIPIGSTYAVSTVFDITSLADGDLLTLDIDQVGVSVPGTSLTVEIRTS